MNKRYKPPFTIYIVWHPDFADGQKIADFLYNSFCRDTETPLNRRIGIPVFYRSKSEKSKNIPKEISFAEADNNAVVVLFDDCLFNDDEWCKYLKNLNSSSDGKSTQIFPVAFSENVTYFDELNFGRKQFINAKDWSQQCSECQSQTVLERIRSQLLHAFCRLLIKEPIDELENKIEPPVKLFISHAKKDGKDEAKNFRDFVQGDTKLKTFFDANDIADGYEFDKQIEQAIQQNEAALVVFHSDAYASREWCQKEVLIAKRFKAPIVVVHDIKEGESRSFPYLGNVPTIALSQDSLGQSNYSAITDLALYQILINIYQRNNLKKIKELYLDSSYPSVELASPPELFNYLDILSEMKKEGSAKKLLVLYPDPPLGSHEMEVLNGVNNEIQFLTPVQLSGCIEEIDYV